MRLTSGILLMLIGHSLFAEQTTSVPPEHFFRLEVLTKEVDGTRTLNSRSYSFPVSTARDGSESIFFANSSLTVGVQNSWQQIKIGPEIRCSFIHEVSEGLAMRLTVGLDSLPADQDQSTKAPLVRNNRWVSTVVLPISKPVIVFSSDDNTSKHTLQVQVTATPIR